ncbi:hypothetical protein G9X67_21125 [Rhizobium sp. WYCCWR 11152]|uniref:hypothetical protein n=1 Tax=Rhizobium sp. WYCCWR 11152 TaxID=2692316 RepID=UPI001492785F|nr:hypothetical protein [Rhizobium sp. WYCCWR 11152]NNU67765.1 hypothetical protein [Rhizobium sp. WYCCWR 11152]
MAHVMAEMREVGKMRRILYKARSRKRWLFFDIAAWWCQCWPPNRKPRTGPFVQWHKPLGSHHLLIFPGDASVSRRRYVFLLDLG